MQAQDLLAAIQIGPIYQHLTIKTARTEESLIQNFWPIRGRENADAVARIETIHLDEQLIEGLLAFVVPSHERCGTARLAQRVEFIDEHDTGSHGLCLTKEVAHTRCPYPHNHLDKLRAAYREERHLGLPRHRTRQQRFPG